VPYLVQALNDEKDAVRHTVAWALGQIGDKRAVPYLRQALQDEDSAICRAIEQALRKLS